MVGSGKKEGEREPVPGRWLQLAGIDGEVACLPTLVSPPDWASVSPSATWDSGGGAEAVSLDVTGGQV